MVLKVSIHICSLCFLNCGSSLNIFSIIETSMSANLCPGRLKCSPVALCLSALVMYPLCSEILSTKLLCVSPIYCILHFLHCIQYTIFFVWQLTCCSISAVKTEAVALTFFPFLIYGHIGHPLPKLLYG